MSDNEETGAAAPDNFPTPEQVDRIILAMKDEGKMLHREDWWEGEVTLYQYDREKGSFVFVEMDSGLGTYMYETPMSEEQMRRSLSRMSLEEIEERGFIF